MHKFLTSLLALALVACAGTPTQPPAPAAPADAYAVTPGPGRADDALYRTLGGLDGITRVIDAMLAEVGNDLRINLLFENADERYLRARLIEQICEAAGGPCTYTGLPMEEAHAGQDISPEEFGYFVEDLNAAMTKAGLAPEAQRQLLALLAPMQPEVVGQ